MDVDSCIDRLAARMADSSGCCLLYQPALDEATRSSCKLLALEVLSDQRPHELCPADPPPAW